MAAHIHLTRHGEVHNPEHVVYADLPGFGVSARGRRQAAEAARHLTSHPVVAVWSSPLQRALETAEPIARRTSLPIRVHDDLTEWHLGRRWAGAVWEELPRDRPGELEAYLSTPELLGFSPESLEEMAVRITRAIRELADRYPEGDVVIVSHQDPVQAARLALTGRDLRTLHTDKPGHAAVITLRPGTPWTEIAAWQPDEQEPFPPAESELDAESVAE